ncbi:MAG: universal stress protein [Cyanobacteria bacterium J06635_15]
MLNKILVAVDKLVASQRAFETALELAKALGSELILVHALDVFDPASPERPTTPVGSYSMELDDILRKNYEHQWAEFVKHYDALLKQKQADAKSVGVEASYLLPYGSPGSAICKTARTSDVDVIVVGSREYSSGLSQLFLGSVSNYILHHAPCSVMVIHPDGGDSHISLGEQSKLSATTMS